MALESPICVKVLSHLPDARVNTAAFAVLMSVSLWIESPVIDLLSTSTTLTRDRESYVAISRFALGVMLLATSVHTLLTLTPLYWLVAKALNAPHIVAEHARVGMIIMIPWSACIGWRRYLQGILIRFGQTRRVGAGTAIRVCTIALVSSLLYFLSSLPGMTIAAIALVCAVSMEASFVHWATRESIRLHLALPHPELPPVTAKKLVRFHAPLTLTTMVTLSAMPLVFRALGSSDAPVLTLAGYQVAQTLMWLHRTVVFALPEVVITLYKDAATAAKLRRFCVGVGLTMSGLMLGSGLSGLDRLIFARVIGADHAVAEVAHIAFLAASATPLLGALQSYIRGMLTAHHLTVARLYAIGVGVTVLVGGLSAGVRLHVPGVIAAGVALSLSMVAELGVLAWFWNRGKALVPVTAPVG